MASFAKNLLDLTADDLMSKELVVLAREMSLRHAAHLLSQAQVTGAPVVDEQGCCVGVLSATDFLHWVEQGEPPRSGRCEGNAIYAPWQVLDLEALPREQVSDFMTADPVLVAPVTPIGELAQLMLDAHIHRVIVTNEHQRPIGVVSSTDVLAALARAHARAHAEPAHT